MGNSDHDKLRISGTEIRKIFESGELPPSWMVRPEISALIHDIISKNITVIVLKYFNTAMRNGLNVTVQ